jgi:hypothetical protein
MIEGRHGNERLMKLYEEDLKQLSEGVRVKVNGKVFNIFVIHYLVVGDIPARCFWMGVSESLSNEVYCKNYFYFQFNHDIYIHK